MRRTVSNPLHSTVMAKPRFNSVGAYWPSYVSPVPNHRRAATQRLDTVSWSTLPRRSAYFTGPTPRSAAVVKFNSSYQFECLFCMFRHSGPVSCSYHSPPFQYTRWMEWNILTRKKGLPFKAEDTSKRGDRLAAPPLWIGTYFTTRYRPAKWNSQR